MVLDVYHLSLSKPVPGVCLEKDAYLCYPYSLYQSFRTRLICIICKFSHSLLHPISLLRHKYIYIQGVPGGMCQTSGECSLC